MKTTKNNNERVVKPVKGNFISLIKKGKKDEPDVEITLLTVVDQDGDVVKTFSKTDHGPRFFFKAKQFADQNSTLDQRLSIAELD